MEQINACSIFSPATGFIQRGGFDWTCNPYVGCSFGCVYCYAMFLPQNRRPREDWGKWFQAKINAIELARKQAPKIAGQAVYISSVTDPYLPAERSLRPDARHPGGTVALSAAPADPDARAARGARPRRAATIPGDPCEHLDPDRQRGSAAGVRAEGAAAGTSLAGIGGSEGGRRGDGDMRDADAAAGEP